MATVTRRLAHRSPTATKRPQDADRHAAAGIPRRPDARHALSAARSGRAAVPDRLCQCRQSPAGAGDGPIARDGAPRRARRRSLANRPPARRREPDACGDRRRCGTGLAYLGTPFLVRMAPIDLPRLDEIVRRSHGARLLGAGLDRGEPRLRSRARVAGIARRSPRAARRGRRHGSIGAASNRLRTCLAVGEIALAVVLAVGGGLLFRSFIALSTTDLGYRTTNVTIVKANAPTDDGIPAARQTVARYERLFPALASIPGR